MPSKGTKSWLRGVLSSGGILVYFIMAFEFMIMISPFAFVFYSVFNPILLFLGRFPATRWLTGFFLPHMIYPPSALLVDLRILGSVLSVLGLVVFLICAAQVYLGKILKWGVARKGLYRVIRHPQYLGLAVCGAGLTILWPRFVVLASFALMLVLYFFLARDEERRMTDRFGDSYRSYRGRTGMFVPRLVERPVAALASGNRLVVIPVSAALIVVAAGFGLRALTVAELPARTEGNLTVVSMLPEDNGFLNCVATTLSSTEPKVSGNLVLDPNEAYLGYLMPVDYVMQGMIANTGESSQLYKQHHTVAMIGDWIFHPFRHLREGAAHCEHMPPGHTPAMARRHQCPLSINDPTTDCADCSYRRVVLVAVNGVKKPASKQRLLALNAVSAPVGYLDIDVHSGKVIAAATVERKTAWQEVPTPTF